MTLLHATTTAGHRITVLSGIDMVIVNGRAYDRERFAAEAARGVGMRTRR